MKEDDMLSRQKEKDDGGDGSARGGLNGKKF